MPFCMLSWAEMLSMKARTKRRRVVFIFRRASCGFMDTFCLNRYLYLLQLLALMPVRGMHKSFKIGRTEWFLTSWPLSSHSWGPNQIKQGGTGRRMPYSNIFKPARYLPLCSSLDCPRWNMMNMRHQRLDEVSSSEGRLACCSGSPEVHWASSREVDYHECWVWRFAERCARRMIGRKVHLVPNRGLFEVLKAVLMSLESLPL